MRRVARLLFPIIFAAACAGCAGDRDKNKNSEKDRPKPAEKGA